MIIFKSANELSKFLALQKNLNRKIGFVPTMGALHEGHLSLIRNATQENDVTVCSIFINPTQFNNANDFARYPVTIEGDIELLVQASCTVLFLPSAEEVYGEGYIAPFYELGSLETALEGKYRPGHFQGVCQVMDRLLAIIPCHFLYLGQKDYQQCMVIQRLLQLTDRAEAVQLRIAPTIRENNGLAMSSRNMRLTPEQKTKAIAISAALYSLKDRTTQDNHQSLEYEASQQLTRNGFVVDYVSIVDGQTLEPATPGSRVLVCLIAATIGGVRLIDNMRLN